MNTGYHINYVQTNDYRQINSAIYKKCNVQLKIITIINHLEMNPISALNNL